MATISFAHQQYPPITVPDGANLLEALLEHHVPVASSCGGEGVCTKCLVIVHSGMENLSAINELEADLRNQHGFPLNQRVSCQCHVHGDITIDAGYW